MITKLLNNESADFALLHAGRVNRKISQSLRNLGSGLRINTAIDDSASMQIADHLKLQYISHKQAAVNAEQTADIVKIASSATKEQAEILNTIKQKAIQAAQDSISDDSKAILQRDITNLVRNMDRIAMSAKYNGSSLLTGSYSNKSFQIGAYSNETMTMSFGNITSRKIGSTSFMTSGSITDTGNGGYAGSLTFNNQDGTSTTLNNVELSFASGTGIGALADRINANSDKLGGLKASWKTEITGDKPIAGGRLWRITLNYVDMPDINGILPGDSDGRLVEAFRKVEAKTGVEATVDESGVLHLRSLDGRGITFGISGNVDAMGLEARNISYGRMTYSRPGSAPISITGTGSFNRAGARNILGNGGQSSTMNLSSLGSALTRNEAYSIGMFANNTYESKFVVGGKVAPGLMTNSGASAVMNIVESTLTDIERLSSRIATYYKPLLSASDNNKTQVVSVQAAHTELVGVDFAVESSNFSKANVLAQAGTYALQKAQQVVKNVFKLLEV